MEKRQILRSHLNSYISLAILLFLVTMPSHGQIVKFDTASRSFCVEASVESDSDYRCLLGKYVSACLKGDKNLSCSSDSLSCLFRRPSFVQVATYIIDLPDRDILLESGYSADYWDDYSLNVLYWCDDVSAIHNVVDSLFCVNNSAGIPAIWKSCDFSKLPNLSSYLKRINNVSKRTAVLSELLIVSHNAGDKQRVKKYRSQLKRLNYHEYARIGEFISSCSGMIDYDEFLFNFLNSQ